MGSHAFATHPPAETARVLDSLRWLVRFLRVSSPRSGSRTLSSAQLFVLAQLESGSAPSIRALSERTMTDPSSVSVVVAKLETRGLISTHQSSRDRRRTELALTGRGRRALASAPTLPQVALGSALTKMPAAHRRAIARELERLVDALGADGASPPMFFEDEPGRSRGHDRG